MDRTMTTTARRPRRGSDHVARQGGREILLAVLFSALLMASAVIPAALRSPAPAPPEVATVKVESGQTLWAIARCYAPQGASTAETVEILRELNGLGDLELAAGTVLLVPRPAPDSQFASR